MRYTPTLKLSTRLVAFVTMIVVSAMFILFIGGVLAFQKMGTKYIDQHLRQVTQVIDDELAQEHGDEALRLWLPKLLKANNVIALSISLDGELVYQYQDVRHQVRPDFEKNEYQNSYPLQKNVGYQATFTVLPPYTNMDYSFDALISLTLAVALVVFCLLRGLSWLKEQLYGSELLEERGRMILAGHVEQYARGDKREWPYTASDALDVLIDELQDARQERSRFDTFIRTHTFLDQLTGAANRVLFDSKLESALQENGSTGAVLVVAMKDWGEQQELISKEQSDQFLIEVGRVLTNLAQKYPNTILSRYYQAQFAFLIPHQTSKEMTHFAGQCINYLERLTPPAGFDKEDWCHVGVTFFQQGDRRGYILEEAESALRAARAQNNNTWSKFHKNINSTDKYKGGVRWRNLFDLKLNEKNLYIYQQPCYLIAQDKHLVHQELFSRIEDESGHVLKASRFFTAIEQVGYETKLDKVTISKVLAFVKQADNQQNYSINVFIKPFQKKEYRCWFRDELLQLTRNQRHQLAFEFVEGNLVNQLDIMRPVLKMIAGFGCKVVVNQVGRTIVSTHYTRSLPIDYIKLHRSLIKQIDKRSENQLFIRSLLGSYADSDIKVIAVGVENQIEWNALAQLGVAGGQGRWFEAESQLLPQLTQQASHHNNQRIKPGRRNRWRK